MKLKTLLHDLRHAFRLEAQKIYPHRIFAMLTVYPLLAFYLGSWLDAAALAIGGAFLAEYAIRSYLDRLATRTEAKTGRIWVVEIDQVMAGTITDADYAAIKLRAASNTRLYYAQSMNLFRVAFNSFEYSCRIIPIGAFWVVLGLAVFSPHTITETATAIQHATPSDINQAPSMVRNLLVLTMLVVIGCHFAFGHWRLGFVNRFDEDVATAIHQRFSAAAEGKVVLSDGGLCVDRAAPSCTGK